MEIYLSKGTITIRELNKRDIKTNPKINTRLLANEKSWRVENRKWDGILKTKGVGRPTETISALRRKRSHSGVVVEEGVSVLQHSQSQTVAVFTHI